MNPECFTLLVGDGRAQLLDGQGVPLAEVAGPVPGGFRGLLPPGAPVDVILATPGLEIQCQDMPRLSRREAREVALRLGRELPAGEPRLQAQVLEPDPRAEGGHVLWMASLPRAELDGWLGALGEAEARPVGARPWQRAFLGVEGPEGSGMIHLVRWGDAGHLLGFRGRSLIYFRTFTLPEVLEPGGPGEGLGAFCRLAREELARLLAFLQQKHRGLGFPRLATLGFPEPAPPALEELGQALGLELVDLGPEVAAFLRARGGPGLDLLPEELRDGSRKRVARVLVGAAAAVLLVIGPGTWALLARHEGAMVREALRAEAALEQRRSLAREAEEAVRLRFGFLRVRRAEARQRAATEQLERLGLRLFRVPDGVILNRVEIRQVPGEALVHRFTVAGTALTRRGFSLGGLGRYLHRLEAHPGMRLEPLREVAVVDRSGGESPGLPPEVALTRFEVGGEAP